MFLNPPITVFHENLIGASVHGSTLTKDTINKVVEFLMTFNSRTCQLVLGAGAMRSAGLKHITAKHLGSSSYLTFWDPFFRFCVIRFTLFLGQIGLRGRVPHFASDFHANLLHPPHSGFFRFSRAYGSFYVPTDAMTE